MKLTTCLLMLSALSMADASSLSVEEKLSQRIMSSANNQNSVANPSARQLLDQVRQNQKSIHTQSRAAQFENENAPLERKLQVVTEPRSLRSKNSQIINHRVLLQSVQRKLPMTGHIWDACLPDSTPTDEEITSATFNGTTYDDALNPYCTCLYDPSINELWLQCAMGDTQCTDANCEETHEIFIFAPSTGDLAVKNTCNFCTDYSYQNCTGIQEICSVVYFDDNETPEQCFFQELLQDGTLQRCDNCQICSNNGELGMNYDCFGQSTSGGCDTSQSFHIHNFAPVLTPGKEPVGGRFEQLCRKNEEFAIYDKVDYDEGLSSVCDCDDPTAGVIVCDLFFPADFCIANECSPISEIFYFDDNDLNHKLTCDGTNGLCSDVFFDQNSGTPTRCEVMLFPDPEPCTSCSICQDETTNAYGIQFNCFGADQNKCLTENGRAINNFVDQPTAPPTSVEVDTPPPKDNDTTEPPKGTPDESTTPVSKAVSEEPSVPVGAIVGAFVGGLALAGLFAFFWSRKNKTDVEQDTNPMGGEHEPPVDEAHQDEMDEAEPIKEVGDHTLT